MIPRLKLAMRPALALIVFLAHAGTPSAEEGGGVQTSFELLVHPVSEPALLETRFAPLVERLNATMPYTIRLKTVRDFHRYWLDVRRGESPDFVFEDAHITAWRMQRNGYIPLVRPLDPAIFYLLTTEDLADAGLDDFVGRRISCLPAPSLGFVILARWYDNPLQQPVIQSNATSWLDAVETLAAGSTDAAIAPAELAGRFPELVTVAESPRFPGLTLSARPDIDPVIREQMRDALLELHADAELADILLERDIPRFVAADPAEYEGLDAWLQVIFGM